MSHADHEKGGLWRFVRKLLSFLLALLMGVILTVLVFLALPFLQNISGGPQETDVVSDAPTIEAPEEMELEEPPPPPEEPEEQEPEPPMEPLDAPTLADLTNQLSGAGSGGAGILTNRALMENVAGAADKMLSSAGLDKQPVATYKPAPSYPPEAGGASGSVTVQFVVQTNGAVGNAQVIDSTARVFERPALDAIQKWRFEPGERGGQPAPFKMQQPIRFTR